MFSNTGSHIDSSNFYTAVSVPFKLSADKVRRGNVRNITLNAVTARRSLLKCMRIKRKHKTSIQQKQI